MVNNYQTQTDFKRRQRLFIWCTSIIISHLSTTHSKDSVIYFRLTLMFCSFIDKVYWVWPASLCNKSWQIVFFIYIIDLACTLFYSKHSTTYFIPWIWDNFCSSVPLSACWSLLLKSNRLSVFHQIPKKHSPSSIAQKGPISKPCPLQLVESGIDPFVSGQGVRSFCLRAWNPDRD